MRPSSNPEARQCWTFEREPETAAELVRANLVKADSILSALITSIARRISSRFASRWNPACHGVADAPMPDDDGGLITVVAAITGNGVAPSGGERCFRWPGVQRSGPGWCIRIDAESDP